MTHKLKDWPKAILGREIDFETGAPKAFILLKEKRNALMHFTSSHQSIDMPRVSIYGLADTSVYDDLSDTDALTAIEVAEGMFAEIFRLRGIPEMQINDALHLWTGRMPT